MKHSLKIAFILILTALYGCAARHVNKTQTNIKTSENTQINEVTNTIVFDTVSEISVSLIPIDTSKTIDMIDANGKKTTFKNALVILTKKDASTKVEEKKETETIKNIKTKKEEDIKTVDKDGIKIKFVWVIGLILLLGLIIYNFRNKLSKL